MSYPKAFLRVRGDHYPLNGKLTTVGSSGNSDVHVSAAEAQHAVVEYDALTNAFWLRDLNSLSGTFVNDVPVHGRVKLRNGDKVRFGYGTSYTFVNAQDANLGILQYPVNSRTVKQALMHSGLPSALPHIRATSPGSSLQLIELESISSEPPLRRPPNTRVTSKYRTRVMARSESLDRLANNVPLRIHHRQAWEDQNNHDSSSNSSWDGVNGHHVFDSVAAATRPSTASRQTALIRHLQNRINQLEHSIAEQQSTLEPEAAQLNARHYLTNGGEQVADYSDSPELLQRIVRMQTELTSKDFELQGLRDELTLLRNRHALHNAALAESSVDVEPDLRYKVHALSGELERIQAQKVNIEEILYQTQEVLKNREETIVDLVKEKEAIQDRAEGLHSTNLLDIDSDRDFHASYSLGHSEDKKETYYKLHNDSLKNELLKAKEEIKLTETKFAVMEKSLEVFADSLKRLLKPPEPEHDIDVWDMTEELDDLSEAVQHKLVTMEYHSELEATELIKLVLPDWKPVYQHLRSFLVSLADGKASNKLIAGLCDDVEDWLKNFWSAHTVSQLQDCTHKLEVLKERHGENDCLIEVLEKIAMAADNAKQLASNLLGETLPDVTDTDPAGTTWFEKVCTTLVQQYTDQRRDIEELQRKLDAVTAEHNDTRSTLDEQLQTTAALQFELQELQTTKSALNDRLVHADQKFAAHTDVVANLRAELLALQAVGKEMEMEVQRKATSIQELEAKEATNREELAILSSKLEICEREKAEALERLQSTHMPDTAADVPHGLVEKLNAELANKDAELSRLRHIIDGVLDESANPTRDSDTLIAHLRQEKQRLEHEVFELNERVVELEHAKDEQTQVLKARDSEVASLTSGATSWRPSSAVVPTSPFDESASAIIEKSYIDLSERLAHLLDVDIRKTAVTRDMNPSASLSASRSTLTYPMDDQDRMAEEITSKVEQLLSRVQQQNEELQTFRSGDRDTERDMLASERLGLGVQNPAAASKNGSMSSKSILSPGGTGKKKKHSSGDKDKKHVPVKVVTFDLPNTS